MGMARASVGCPSWRDCKVRLKAPADAEWPELRDDRRGCDRASQVCAMRQCMSYSTVFGFLPWSNRVAYQAAVYVGSATAFNVFNALEQAEALIFIFQKALGVPVLFNIRSGRNAGYQSLSGNIKRD